MSSKPLHHAFRQDYVGLARELITVCHVMPGSGTGTPDASASRPFNFVWDTGATNSVITHAVVEALGLVATGVATVQGVNSVTQVMTFVVDIILPNGLHVGNVLVTESDIGAGPANIQGLIGMDIIAAGDLAISNHGGKTTFSFAFPPFENKTDLLAKANSTNPKPRK